MPPSPFLGPVLAVGLLSVLAAPGCAEPQRLCYPGDYRACECFDGAPGLQRCLDDGESFTDCDCSGGIPSPGDDDSGDDDGGYTY